MARKFKVGDDVRALEAIGRYRKGKVYTVTRVEDVYGAYFINEGWAESHFEKAPQKNHIVLSRQLYDSYTKMTLEDARALAKDGTGPKDDFVVLAFTTGYQGREIRSVEVVEVTQ